MHFLQFFQKGKRWERRKLASCQKMLPDENEVNKSCKVSKSNEWLLPFLPFHVGMTEMRHFSVSGTFFLIVASSSSVTWVHRCTFCSISVCSFQFMMMEDTGEDVLRAKPSAVTTFFKRLGQVREKNMSITCILNLKSDVIVTKLFVWKGCVEYRVIWRIELNIHQN